MAHPLAEALEGGAPTARQGLARHSPSALIDRCLVVTCGP
jgi:hypothetical protein